MDNLKPEMKFNEVRSKLEKALLKPGTIIDLASIAFSGMIGLEFQHRATYCMMLQSLIEGYKNEGSISTEKVYYSFLATLAGRNYVPRSGVKLTGLDEDQILPEILIKSTSKFKEIYGEKETLAPHPAPVSNTFFHISHYEDNSAHSTANTFDRSMIGGRENKMSSLDEKRSSQKSTGITLDINRLLEYKTTKKLARGAVILLGIVGLVLVLNYLITGRSFKIGPISSGDSPSSTTQNHYVIKESEKQRSAELSFVLKDNTSYDCNLCFINSSKPYNGIRQSRDDDQILFAVAVSNIGNFAATSILDDCFFLSTDKTEKGSDIFGYYPEEEWTIDDPENRPKIVAKGNHTFVYKISKEAIKRFKGYFVFEVQYKDENGEDKKLEKAIFIDNPKLGINYTEFDNSQIPKLRKDYYQVMGYDENGRIKLNCPKF